MYYYRINFVIGLVAQLLVTNTCFHRESSFALASRSLQDDDSDSSTDSSDTSSTPTTNNNSTITSTSTLTITQTLTEVDVAVNLTKLTYDEAPDNLLVDPTNWVQEQVMFHKLDQKCKSVVIEYVQSESFPEYSCQEHIIEKPLWYGLPADWKCRDKVCPLWSWMLVEDCRKEMCFIGPYIPDEECGRGFLRELYDFCGWEQRGCSVWAGANVDSSLRNKFVSLTREQQTQWGYLGWDVDNWEDKNHGLVITEIADDGTTFIYDARNETDEDIKLKFDHLPDSEFKCYDELSELEKDAVRMLNFTIMGWHLCGDVSGVRDHCGWPATLPAMKNTGSYRCMDWHSYLSGPMHALKAHHNPSIDDHDVSKPSVWSDLTPQKRQAYRELGYVPGKTENTDGGTTLVAWNERKSSLTFIKPWTEFTNEERQAAEFLMYTEEVWNVCVDDPFTACIHRKYNAEQLSLPTTNLREWDEDVMGAGTRQMLEVIGWSADTWNAGGPLPSTFSRPWNQLTDAALNSTRKLGYHRDSWNGCLGTKCLDKYRYINQRLKCPTVPFLRPNSRACETISWDELNERHQHKLMDLGFDQVTWDRKMLPDTWYLQWKDLLYEEAAAATALGFDKDTWNGCAGSTLSDDYDEGEHALDMLRRIRAEMEIARSYTEVISYVDPSEEEAKTQSELDSVTTEEPMDVETAKQLGNSAASSSTTKSDDYGSFAKMARLAIARASFCNNPPFDASVSQEQIDGEGNPLCTDRDNFETQKDRISILKISKGSIILQFEIGVNTTVNGITAVNAYEVLERKLKDPKSDLRHDAKFGRFASVATLKELEFSEADWIREKEEAQFEKVRGRYNKHNYCELHTDRKHGINPCEKSSSSYISISSIVVIVLLLSSY